MVQMFPRYLSELSIIIGMVILVLLGGENARMLVGIFAVSAFRLLPALRGLLAGFTQVQNALPSLEILEEGVKKSAPNDVVPVGSAPNDVVLMGTSIEIKDVKFSYGDSVLDFGNIRIDKGEYIGFCGYSGVGKTTLFNLILGFLKPQEGEILIDGTPLTTENRKSWLKHIGYVPQDVFIFNGSIAENIALGYKNIDEDKVNKVLKMVSLGDWVASLENGIQSHLGEGGGKLSGGQKQRIGIARALYKGASVLLLDEATSSLDNNTEKEINEMLQELKKEIPDLTILSIAHRESTLAYCNRIINLEENGN